MKHHVRCKYGLQLFTHQSDNNRVISQTVAGETVSVESVSLPASARVAPGGVDALLLAPVAPRLALIVVLKDQANSRDFGSVRKRHMLSGVMLRD